MKKELIDFLNWYRIFDEPTANLSTQEIVDKYLKSINSDHQDKGVTLVPNEKAKKKCELGLRKNVECQWLLSKCDGCERYI